LDTRCYTCKNLGHPNERIKFKEKLGRILFDDGTSQIIGYKLVDYFTEEPHKHKEPKIYNRNRNHVKSLENYFPMSTEQQKQKQQQERELEGRYYKGWDLEALLN
jgi:hypothetical protein